jgi:SAM-dependent methyltransferase
MKEWYKADLAFIHDVGFSDYALKSAPGILEILARGKAQGGLVVDLGCGSGLWAQELVKARYRVLGIDISEAMITLARNRVPEAEFRVGSLFDADIPACAAVTSISECLNYLFDPENNRRTLASLFRRIYQALTPGGVFVFDVAEPGQNKQQNPVRWFTPAADWVVLVEKEEDRKRQMLTRRITTFRKAGKDYQRDEEVHCQRLYRAADLARELRGVGFRVRVMRSYGEYPLPKAHAAFLARKPK